VHIAGSGQTISTIELGIAGDGTPAKAMLYVGQLKNPISSGMNPISKGVSDLLKAAGITEADYPKLLALDPYASTDGSTTFVPDPNRFSALHQNFTYEPPPGPGDTSVTSFSYTIGGSQTASSGKTVETSHSVSLNTGSSGAGNDALTKLIGFNFKQSVSDENAWTWTTSNKYTTTSISSETATVSVGAPSSAYTGSADFSLYIDNIYRTFLFVPYAASELAVTGAAQSYLINGYQPLSHAKVCLTVGGTNQCTYTDVKGTYKFFKMPSGAGTLVVSNLRTPVIIVAHQVTQVPMIQLGSPPQQQPQQ
jgi:hypothetical protein